MSHVSPPNIASQRIKIGKEWEGRTLPAQELQHLNLDEIVRRCQDESRRKRTEETGYCFELFRRALEASDQGAWAAISTQYQALVLKWIHTASPGLPQEEIDDLVQESLIAFWCSLTRRSIRVRKHFPHVGALLNYLQQCTRTAVINYRRRKQRSDRLEKELGRIHSNQLSSSFSEKVALERMCRDKRLQMIYDWVKTSVTDPQEKLVVHLAFRQGIRPADIVALYPAEFPEAKAVYRVQERLLKRAKRALKALCTRGRREKE